MNLHSQILEYYDAMYNYAMTLTHNKMDAEDLVQEAMCTALFKAHLFDGSNKAKSWLFTITRNTFINNYRKEKLRDDVFYQRELNLNKADYFMNENADSLVLVNEIKNTTTQLKQSNYHLLKMYMDGWHYDEIADECDIPIGTVKSRIHFARKEFKEKYINN